MIFGNYKLMGIALKRHFLDCEQEIKRLPQDTLEEKRAALMQLCLYYCAFLVASFFPLWSTAVILSILAHFVGLYSSAIGAAIVCVWMVLDYVMPLVKKPQQEVLTAQNAMIWNQLAGYVVCPVVAALTKREIEPEDLYYSGQAVFGDGFYFKLPIRIRDKTSELILQRRLERKLAEERGCEWAEIAKTKIVRVTPDTVFISEGI